MSTTTTIELTESPYSEARLRRELPDRTDSDNTTEDPVLLASRVADSTVPDGGYGWAVVGGSAVLMWWAVGTTYSWGVIQEALVSQGLSSPGILAFIGSLSATLVAVLGIVNSRIMRLLGARRAALLGVSFVGGSEIISSFATENLGAMFFTAGILLGIGIR